VAVLEDLQGGLHGSGPLPPRAHQPHRLFFLKPCHRRRGSGGGQEGVRRGSGGGQEGSGGGQEGVRRGSGGGQEGVRRGSGFFVFFFSGV
jgi:hypothetical protein